MNTGNRITPFICNERPSQATETPSVEKHAHPPRVVYCGLARLHVTFGGSGGIMTTAGPGLPYPCSPQAKTRDESSRRGK